MHAEGADGEADSEEDGNEEDMPLAEGGAARLGEGTDADVIERQAEHRGDLEEEVIDEQLLHLSAEVDACDSDGEGGDEEGEAEEGLRRRQALLREHYHEGPYNRHHSRQEQYKTPLHKMGYGL